MNRRILLFLLIIVFIPGFLSAVDKQYSNLYLSTVSEDIRTSTFHELSSWCKRLNLSTEGSANEMRQRLYSYYDVQPAVKDEAPAAGSGNLITIESADNLDYFTIEQIDQNYVEITGKVILTLEDEKTGETHKIRADKILYNFKEDYLTAAGNIEYILEGENKTENFKGDKITFNVQTWEGLFNKGVSQEVQQIDDKDVTFFFKGDLINKTEDNFVLLEKGEITSCDLEDPHFKLQAEKLWMLTGDEWAILSGILYIGRVPILYIPAYLNAGDDIFFNPVFGYRNDYGYFIQTTTYLIGKKEKDDSSFSFLQSDDSSSYSRINGIYLTSESEPSDEQKEFVDSFAETDYLKFILDYYSSLGFYSAVESNIKQFSIIDNIKAQASVAFSRKVENSASGYTYLFADENGVYNSIWLSSYFYNVRVPFRYDLDVSFGIDLQWFNIDLLIQNYSDNYYTYAFSDRSENLDLLGMLNQSSASQTSTEITSSDWMLKTSVTPETGFLKPWITGLTISSLQTSIDWRGKEIDTTDLSDPTIYDDTVSYFYYPQEYILPSFSGSLSGQLLPFGTAAAEPEDDENKEEQSIELRPPWEDKEKNDSFIKDNEEFLLPDLRPDIKIDDDNLWDTGSVFTNKLLYSIKPNYSNKTQLNSTDWKIPEDIDLSDIEYSVQSAELDASLSYTAGVFGNFLTLSDTLKFSGKNKMHYDMNNLTAEDQAKFILEDSQATQMSVTNSLQLTSKPLIGVELLTGTTLVYNFDNELYSYDYSTDDDSFLTRFMLLESEDITRHSLKLSLPLVSGDYKQTLTLSSTLPPVDLAAQGSLLIEAGISKTELNTALSESENVITYDPLTINERLSFWTNTYLDSSISYNYIDLDFEKTITSGKLSLFDNNLIFISKFIYDFSTEEISELSADISLFDFFLNVKGYQTEEYDFDPDAGWRTSGTSSFQAKDFSAGFDIESEEYTIWKNRINFDFELKSSVDFDLVQFTNSDLTFSLAFNFDIFDFLTLTLKSESENTVLYKYFPDYTEVIGVPTLNIFEDLLKSFNFLDVNDRYESNFNLKTISIGLTHDLHDWDLNMKYSGSPYIDKTSGIPKYEWKNILSIYLKWKAVTDIKTDIEIDNGDVSF